MTLRALRTQVATLVRRRTIAALTRIRDVRPLRPLADHALRHVFDQLADRWDVIRRDPTYREGLLEALESARGANIRHPQHVLDVACGTGLATRVLCDQYPDAHVTGCDIAPEMIARARTNVANAAFDVASVRSLPYPNAHFDLITVLDGLVDIGELTRVLSPGGHLVIIYSRHGTTPVSRDIEHLAQRCRDAGLSTTAHAGDHARYLVVTRPT